MNEGLMKNSSLTAIAVAAGLMLSFASAFAADLGGNCCADLEERVAELEATAARKGTRKTSLEIYGDVNRAVTYWDDGSRSNVNIGADNWAMASRFGLRGKANIYTGMTSGYSLLLDIADNARTGTFSQTQDVGATKEGNAGSTRTGDDPIMRLRDANFWVESDRLGRLTLGRVTSEALAGSIDIAGIYAGVNDDPGCNGGGLFFRNATTGLLGASGVAPGSAGNTKSPTIGTGTGGGCSGLWSTRLEALKYTSPNFHGFQVVADIGRNAEAQGGNVDSTIKGAAFAGQELSAALRYAGEYSGVRLAGQIGWKQDEYGRDESTAGPGNADGTLYANGDYQPNTGAGPGYVGNYSSGKVSGWEGTLALLHVPTGLFAQGEYTRLSFQTMNPLGVAQFTSSLDPARDATRWHIAAGLQKNWFGVGTTSLYGEYEENHNFQWATAGYTVTCAAGATTCNGTTATSAFNSGTLSGDKMTFWGLGVNQAIDSAAMDVYANYRDFSMSDPNNAGGYKNINVITTGARIKF